MTNREQNIVDDILMVISDSANKSRHAFELVAENETDLYLPSNSRARSFGVLVERAFSFIWHGKIVWCMQIVSYLVIAAFISIGNYNGGHEATTVMRNIHCVLFTILFIVLIGMMPTIVTFPRQINEFVRENRNHKYSTIAFYLAKILIDLPLHLLFSSIYTIVIYSMTSQPMNGKHFHPFTAICVMTSLVSYSIGLIIAIELSGKPNTTQEIVTLAVIVPVVLFTGFIIDFNLIPNNLRGLTWISYVRYAFEGAVIALYGFGREKLKCTEAYCHFRNPLIVLREFSMQEDNYFTDENALAYVFMAFQVVALVLLLWKIRSKQYT